MNILLTSIGRRTYIVDYFKDALKDIGLVHVSNSINTPCFKHADKFTITPLIYNNSYIDFLLEYSKKNKIEAIISFYDPDILILSKQKNRFKKAGVELIISDYQIVKTCNDKWLMYKFLEDNNLYTPATFLTIKDVIESIKKNKIRFPLIIKPRMGMGSIGIYEADNIDELKIFYLKTEKAINNSYLKFDNEPKIENNIIIQEKIEGDEIGLDILNDLQGNFCTCIPKLKLEMRAGETNSSKIINDLKFITLGEKVSSILKHVGNLDIDCFEANNKIYIVDINCRFGGQYPFSHLAGANFPKAIVSMLLKREIDASFLAYKPGIVGVKSLVPEILKSI